MDVTLRRLPLIFVCLLLVSGITSGAGSERGPQLLAPFKQQLQQALRDGLARGPAEAIAVCRDAAPEIAEALSQDGVRIGRTSHRLRNPSNAGPHWVLPILENYANNASERLPRTVTLGDNRTGYVEPIIVQVVCLTCHGDNLAPEVAEQVNKLYPDDKAVGFSVGDLRGVFWVEFPASE